MRRAYEHKLRRKDELKLIGALNHVNRTVDALNRIEHEIWQGRWGNSEMLDYIRETLKFCERAQATMRTLMDELR